MLKNLKLLFLTTTSLIAGVTDLSSNEAYYDKNALVLKGEVFVDHLFARMIADEAYLLKESPDLPLSRIVLKEGAKIETKKGARLFCDEAEVDFTQMTGAAKSLRRPLFFEDDSHSLKMYAHLLSFDIEHLAIERLKLSDRVEIVYEGEMLLFADTALFEKEAGQIFVRAKEKALCELSRGDDQLFAEAIDVNLTQKELFLQAATGSALGYDIEAENLLWQQDEQALVCEGKSALKKEGFGLMTCLGHVTKDPLKLQAKGETTLISEKKGVFQKMQCYETITYDEMRCLAVAEGRSQQVRYETCDVTLFADHVEVSYEKNRPKIAMLTGHIRLFSVDEAAIKCGRCDRMEYDLQEKRLKLTSLPGQRVLFWNKEKGLSLSAEEIYLSGDEVIEGVGCVRFSFTSDEDFSIKKKAWKKKSS